jgi:pimeloyl-ACP methyl ester carboxylesterase
MIILEYFSMKIIINNTGHKISVIFIHGYTKSYTDWNETAHHKEIGIESHIRKIRNTILVDLSEEDYVRPVIDVVNEIYNQISEFLKTKIVCVCHSYGSFFGMQMAISYPKLLYGLILLDPSLKIPGYLEYLKTCDPTPTTSYKINHWDDLPDHLNVPQDLIAWTHLNFTSDDLLRQVEKITALDKLTKKNTKSKLMLHVDVSHMIHYKIPHVIIDSIKNITK